MDHVMAVELVDSYAPPKPPLMKGIKPVDIMQCHHCLAKFDRMWMILKYKDSRPWCAWCVVSDRDKAERHGR